MWAGDVLQNGNEKVYLMFLPKGNKDEGACLWQLGSRQRQEGLQEMGGQARNMQRGGGGDGEEDDNTNCGQCLSTGKSPVY